MGLSLALQGLGAPHHDKQISKSGKARNCVFIFFKLSFWTINAVKPTLNKDCDTGIALIILLPSVCQEHGHLIYLVPVIDKHLHISLPKG